MRKIEREIHRIQLKMADNHLEQYITLIKALTFKFPLLISQFGGTFRGKNASYTADKVIMIMAGGELPSGRSSSVSLLSKDIQRLGL